VEASANDYGIERYYQMWIQPYDNLSMLLVVYVLELPPQFPIAHDGMQEEVELTGFFFKRWAYRAKDAIRSTPMLLAKTVRWTPPAVAQEEPIGPMFLGGIIACALAIAGMVVWMAARGATPAYAGPQPPRRWGQSEDPDERPTGDVLQALAEQAEADAGLAAGEPPRSTSPDNQRPAS
jgi:hypothetical protein